MNNTTSPQAFTLRLFFSLMFALFFIFSNAQIITTIAGNGTAANTGDGGPASAAELNAPVGVAEDASGNLYIAAGARIRRITPSGTISTIAGNGLVGFSGNGGQATAAELSAPADVTVDAFGNIYIADAGNERIRKVNTSGIISTYAGNGAGGYSGDGAAATAAELNNPLGIAVDGSGNIYVAEQANHTIRMINTSGIISTIAGVGTHHGYTGDGGTATAAELYSPYGVTVDVFGNVYIADEMNYVIRKVNTSGNISTFAGNGIAGSSGNTGQATAAELNGPTGVRQDGLGNLYIADAGNAEIRKVNTSGIITRFAGNYGGGFSGDGGQATAAEIANPRKIALDNLGNLFIADKNNERIRIVYALLTVSASVTTSISCYGGNNGIATASPRGGTSPYTYSWSGGGTNSTKTGLSIGTYTITVTDAYSQTASATVTVTQPPLLTVSTSLTMTSSLYINANASGGTSPYTYSWSPSSGLSCSTCQNAVATPTATTTYSVTITDNNGCTATASVTANVNTGSAPSLLSTPPITQWTYAAPGQYSNGIGFIGQDWIYQIIQSQDGSNSYYAAGYTTTDGCNTVPVILKLDQSGNKLWEYYYLPPGCTTPWGTNGTCGAILDPYQTPNLLDQCQNGVVMSGFFTIKEIADPASPTSYGIMAVGHYAEDYCSSSSYYSYPVPNSAYTTTCVCTPNNNVYPNGGNPDNKFIYAVEVDGNGSVISDASNNQFYPINGGVREFWGNMLVDPSLNYVGTNLGIAQDPIINQGGGGSNIDYVYFSPETSTNLNGLIIACHAWMNVPYTSAFGQQPTEAMLVKLDKHFNLDNNFGTGSPQQGYGLYPDPTYTTTPTNPTLFGGVAVINNNSSSPYYVVSGNVVTTLTGNPTNAIYQGISTYGNTQLWHHNESSAAIASLAGGFPSQTSSLTTAPTFTPNTFATEVKYVNSSEVLIHTWCNWTQGGGPDFYPLGTDECNSYGTDPSPYMNVQDAVLKINPTPSITYNGSLISGSTGAPNGVKYLKQFEGIDFLPKLVTTADGGYAVCGDFSFNLPRTPDNMSTLGVHLGVYNDLVKFNSNDQLQWDQVYMANSEVNGLLCSGSGILTGVGTNCSFGLAATNDNGYIMAGNTELNGDDYYAIKVEPPTCTGAFTTAVSQLNSPPSGYTVITNGIIIPFGTTYWSGNYLVQGYVEVQPGGVLQIEPGTNVYFANPAETGVETQIVLDQGDGMSTYGGILTLNGVDTLTAIPTCITGAGLWDGIELRGNSIHPQSYLYDAAIDAGANSYIKYMSSLGIKTIKTNVDLTQGGHEGGQITATSANFIDNVQGPQFFPYSYTDNSNFTLCNFTTDANYLSGASLPTCFVNLNGTTGETFYGNTFQNTKAWPTSAPMYELHGNGLNSTDANYTVSPDLTGTPTPNTFSGLNYGVYATSTSGIALTIAGTSTATGKSNVFTNNYYDIYLLGTNHADVEYNIFSKANIGNFGTANTYNLFFDGNGGMSFTDKFNTYGSATSSLHPSTNYGDVVNNSGGSSYPSNVEANTYIGSNNMNYGTYAEGSISPLTANLGLQILCNTFSYDINLTTYSADIGVANSDGSVPDQGTSGTPAGNIFNNICTTNTPYDFYNGGNTIANYYYCSTCTNNDPTCVYNITNVNGRVASPGCPTPNTHAAIHHGHNLASEDISVSGEYAERSYDQNIADSLGNILSNGNKHSFYTDLNSLSPIQIEDSLFVSGPYLSDSILNATILDNLPVTILENILIPNSPLDNNVITTLNTISLPDSIVNQLNAYQSDSILSPRTILQNNISYYLRQVSLATNALVTYYVNDTIVGRFDSAIAAIQSLQGPLSYPYLAQVAQLQITAGEYTPAVTTLTNLKSADANYSNFCQLMNILIALRGEPNGYYALKGDSTNIATVNSIAIDSTHPGYANARALMRLVFNKQYFAPIFPITHNNGPQKTHKKIIVGSNSSLSSNSNSQFKIYPNPAKYEITIAYNLAGSVQKAKFILYNEFGNSVSYWNLPLSKTQINENISSLSGGLYLYCIMVDGKAVQRGKLVLEK